MALCYVKKLIFFETKVKKKQKWILVLAKYPKVDNILKKNKMLMCGTNRVKYREEINENDYFDR